MLQFERPLFLIFLPAFYLLSLMFLRKQKAWPHPLDLWGAKAEADSPLLWRMLLAISRVFILASASILLIVTAGPLKSQASYRQRQTYMDIIFVVDVSPSMAAMDISPNRLEAAKAIIRDYIENPKNASSAGIIAFGESASLICPVSPYMEQVELAIRGLTPGALGDGTAIGQGLALALRHLALAKGKNKAIILLSDGEDNIGMIDPQEVAQSIKNSNVLFALVGLGSSGDVPFYYENPNDNEVLSGRYHSDFNEEWLVSLASNGGGYYYTASGKTSEEIGQLTGNYLEGSAWKEKGREGAGPFLSIMVLLLAALAWFIRYFLLGGVV